MEWYQAHGFHVFDTIPDIIMSHSPLSSLHSYLHTIDVEQKKGQVLLNVQVQVKNTIQVINR